MGMGPKGLLICPASQVLPDPEFKPLRFALLRGSMIPKTNTRESGADSASATSTWQSYLGDSGSGPDSCQPAVPYPDGVLATLPPFA